MRVCVIGAGAGGLSAAYYLRRRGYRHVTVLERADRVGGLCHSFTFDGRGFDLGGNYVLPGYRKVRELAADVGAPLVVGPDRRTWDHTMDHGRGGLRTPLATMLQAASLPAFLTACSRYLWMRWRLGDAFARPGFGAMSRHPELCVPLDQFLTDNALEPLRRLFAIPISIMGYGAPGMRGRTDPSHPFYLENIAAGYALDYLDVSTALVLMLVGAGLSNSWPKRFEDGYQRLWERVAWGVDVRLGSDVEAVRRDGGVTVTWRQRAPHGDGTRRSDTFDALILACPFPDALAFLDADDEERALFGAIRYNAYEVTTAVTSGMPDHIVDVIPLTTFGHPWALVKQWPDSDVCVYYTPVDDTVSSEDVRRAIGATVGRVGGRIEAFHTSQRWRYFPHVTPDEMAAGFYDRLEARQGRRHTWLAGNTMSFELAARAVEYSHALVADHFPAIAAPKGA